MSSAPAPVSAAGRFEAARLRHQRLLDIHDGGSSSSNTDEENSALAAGRLMSSRAGMASVLHRAIAEAGGGNDNVNDDGSRRQGQGQQHADVRHLMALLDATLPSNDAAVPRGETAAMAGWAAKSNRDHPIAACTSTATRGFGNATGGATANDFFAEYPGCVRTDYSEEDGSSSCSSSGGSRCASGGEEEDNDVVHVQMTGGEKQRRPVPQQQRSQHPQQPPPPNPSASQPQLNPYLYGGSSQGSGPPPSGPPPPPPPPGAAVAGGWSDYEPPSGAPSGYRHNGGGGGAGGGGGGTAVSAGGGKANPFQTAREFAGTGGGDDPALGGGGAHSGRGNTSNNNGCNHSYGNNPYGGHAGTSSGNPYGNPYQTSAHGHANATGGNSVPSAAAALNRPEISAGLKRKFQPPKRIGGGGSSGGGVGKDTKMVGRKVYGGGNNGGKSGGGPSSSVGGGGGGNGSGKQEDDEELPEELQGLDKELVNKIMNEIVDSGESITFDDIAGLADAKQTVLELVCWPMKRPDLFTGLRRGPNGLLLFGPPGTGKTLIGKAIAHESGACFFSISSSSLTSKWIGEGEKLVRTLFAVAAYREPAVVFIDEIDSLLTARKADENEASRRIKTEFLVQLDGTGTSGQGRLLCIGECLL